MPTTNWKRLRLSGDPILVIGLRPKSKIDGYGVVVDKNVHPALSKVAEDALADVARRTRVDYTPYVAPGEDEYLWLNPAALTTTVAGYGVGQSQRQQTARLPRSCRARTRSRASERAQ